MKLNFWYVPVIACTLYACNNNTQQASEKPISATDSANTNNTWEEYKITPAAGEQCYQYINAKDTATLHITIDENVVTGRLTYKLFQKDANTGSLSGRLYGDTLKGDYTFMSEGTTSVRAVAFLKKGSEYVEALGEREEKDNRQVFKSTNNMRFEGISFAAIECEKK
jgi:hypothetical protein